MVTVGLDWYVLVDRTSLVLYMFSFKAGFHFARPNDGLSGHAQLEIQAESERLLVNARSVLEVESSSTFSLPE